MSTWRIELHHARVAYPNTGLIELQIDVLVDPAPSRDGSAPSSFLTMTPETARQVRHLLGVALGDEQLP